MICYFNARNGVIQMSNIEMPELEEIESRPSDYHDPVITPVGPGMFRFDGWAVNNARIQAETLATLTNAVQEHMDETAAARGYDDLRSVISYRGSSNPTWASEADSFFAWRDACWVTCYQIQSDVAAGTRPIPSVEDLIAALPPYAG
jgi:hypothetical protein